VSELQRVIEAIQGLPDKGEGMTVGQIADAVEADTGTVVMALEEIVEQDEADGSE
jgi:hypothetical protein